MANQPPMTASSAAVPLSERAMFEAAAREEWADKNIPDAAWIGWQLRAALAAGQASADGARSAEAGGVDEDLLRRRAFSIGITIDQARAVLALASTPTSTSAPEVAAPATDPWGVARYKSEFSDRISAINAWVKQWEASGVSRGAAILKAVDDVKRMHWDATSPAPAPSEPPAAQAASEHAIEEYLKTAVNGTFPDTTPGVKSYWLSTVEIRAMLDHFALASTQTPTPVASSAVKASNLLDLEAVVEMVRRVANAGYGYGPKGSREEFDRAYAISPLQLLVVVRHVAAASEPRAPVLTDADLSRIISWFIRLDDISVADAELHKRLAAAPTATGGAT